VLLDVKYEIHFERDSVPLSALELHEAVRTDGDEGVVMARGVERREAPMAPRTDPQPREGTIYGYWWVCWPQRQNPFTQPHFAARKRLVIFDNEAFRTTTWYRGPAKNLQRHRPYAAGAFIPTTDRTQIEWTPRVPELRVRRTALDTLEVEIRGATPNLDAYLVQFNGDEPYRCEDGHARWKRKRGDNTLRVQTRNLFAIDGPPVTAHVTFQT
jgi:hypothetical protein